MRFGISQNTPILEGYLVYTVYYLSAAKYVITGTIMALMCNVAAGTLYVQTGRLDDAESYLKHALKLNPSHHGAMNNLRVVEYQRKSQKKPR